MEGNRKCKGSGKRTGRGKTQEGKNEEAHQKWTEINNEKNINMRKKHKGETEGKPKNNRRANRNMQSNDT